MKDKQDPIAHAARLLREAAEEWRDAHPNPAGNEDFEGRPDAKAAHDEHMAAAQALEDWELAVGAGGVQAMRAAPAELEQLKGRIARIGLDIDRALRGMVNTESPVSIERLQAIAALADGPAGSGGWQSHAQAMERERDYYRQRAQTMHGHQSGECWYWQGDGGDHLQSMVNSLPVVIRADQLRELVAAAPTQQAQAAINSGAHAVPVVWLSGKQLHGITAIHGSYLPFRRQRDGLFDTPVYLEAAAPQAAPASLSDAARDVLVERQRQISAEGWTPEHDDEHLLGELSQAAACYSGQAFGHYGLPKYWPWAAEWWKPSQDPRRNLAKAGALILAEMERIDRAALAAQGGA